MFFVQNISLDKDTYIKCKMLSNHMFFVFFDNNYAQLEYSKIGNILIQQTEEKRIPTLSRCPPSFKKRTF